jgi:hypothetical protein
MLAASVVRSREPPVVPAENDGRRIGPPHA